MSETSGPGGSGPRLGLGLGFTFGLGSGAHLRRSLLLGLGAHRVRSSVLGTRLDGDRVTDTTPRFGAVDIAGPGFTG